MNANSHLNIEMPPSVLEARGLTKTFTEHRPFSSEKSSVTAFKSVDLSLFPGRTVALVGESGAGKSTLAQCLVRLEQPTAGELVIDGQDFLALTGRELRHSRRKVQLIFQEAMAALNPWFSAGEIIGEPLVVADGLNWKDAREKSSVLMESVGLSKSWSERRAHEFSGGQKQRLALARALALNPKILILDEALSGLDLLVQGQMVELIVDLQAEHNLAFLFISHDLNLISSLADDVAVIKNGLIVEYASVKDIFSRPQHSYTQSLISAMHELQEGWGEESKVLA